MFELLLFCFGGSVGVFELLLFCFGGSVGVFELLLFCFGGSVGVFELLLFWFRVQINEAFEISLMYVCICGDKFAQLYNWSVCVAYL